MVQVVLNFPDEALLDRYQSPEAFGEKMRLTAALAWYQQGDISLEEAVQIAGLNPQGFLAVLAEHNIDVSQISPEKDDAKKQVFFERLKGHKVYLPEDYPFNRDKLYESPITTENDDQRKGTEALFAPLRGKVKYFEDLTMPTTEEWGEV